MITDVLLVLVIIILAADFIRREKQHRELMEIFNDAFTMIGEVFPFLRTFEELLDTRREK